MDRGHSRPDVPLREQLEVGFALAHSFMDKAARHNYTWAAAGYKVYVTEREAAFRKEWERQKQNPTSPAAR